MPRRSNFFVSLVACVLLHSPTAAGQTVGTSTGALNGKVTDNTGAVLPGVTIVVSSDAMIGNKGTRTAVTDEEGFYRFPALPPGEYTLTFALEGFKTLYRQGIHIAVGFTATINVELQIATLNERVIVERTSPVIDKHSTAVATDFDAGQLAKLPGARNMTAILAATPAVQFGRLDVGVSAAARGPQGYSAYGAAGQSRPMVEGINVAGILLVGLSLDYGSLEEVSVGTAAHGAEWPWAGVQMQFLSKSGGNQYRGTLYTDYTNEAWQSFNVDEDQILRGARGGGGLSPHDVNRVSSYHDVNSDIGGYLRKDSVWWYSSFRDQRVSVRQVNFPVKPHQTNLRNYSAKGTYQLTHSNKFVVYGQAGRNHQPNVLTPFGQTGGLTAATAINESEESTAELRGRGWVWKGEWNGVIHDRLFLEARAGQFGANRPETPNATSPRFEDVATLIVRGGNRDWQHNLRRNQVLGSLSYFKNGWFGNHHFKSGGEIFRLTLTETWRTGYPHDVLHVLQNGLPREVYLFQTPSKSEGGFWTYSGYANDSWALNDRMSLNLGLRFDRYRVFLPEQTHPVGRFNGAAQTFPGVGNVIDWNVLAPRIGATYGLTGDGTTILKFNYGQYWSPPGFELIANANPNANPWWQRYAWDDPDGSGVWEPGEEGRLAASRGGVALESIDPKLQLPFVKEVGAWVERELARNVGVRTGVVWRGSRQNFMRQNISWPFEAFTVPVTIRDPGPDGNTGTVDDRRALQGFDLRPEFVGRQLLNIVRNVPHSDTHYWTWDVTARKRFSQRWSFVAAFSHTWSRDHANAYLGQTVRQNTYPLTPNDLINAGTDGRYEFRTWSAKIHGTYDAPWDLRVTPLLRHQSGQPFGRTLSAALNYSNNVRILAEPIGTRRMDNVTIFDLRVEKAFRVAGDHRVATFVDVFNLFNANPEQNTNWSSGSSFLRPLDIVSPRIARVGAKLEW